LLDHESLEVARDKEEGHRVAYVAATRARDLLVVPAVGDGPLDDGWVSPVNAAIYPPFDRRRTAEPAPGCPVFKRDSVLERPNDDPARADTVHPGLHRFASETDEAYDVVWWDPGVLELDREPPKGVRHESLIGKDAPRAVVDETLAAYRAWEESRAAALASGSAPSIEITTATQWAAGVDEMPGGGAVAEVAVMTVEGSDAARPSGAVFGALVHAVLAGVKFDAGGDAVLKTAQVHARLVGASEADAVAAASVASRVLAHPLLARARAASLARREVPVMLATDTGALVEGVADLAFLENDAWTIVDFKTDLEIGRIGLDAYRRQVGFYAAAIARATGQSATAVLLRI
jgi:ATP-dependent exoDNAse (exonuclease V) beta subunit